MERRSLLKRATCVLGGLFAALLGLPGMAYLVDPRNTRASSGLFTRVARLSDLRRPAQGEPAVPMQVVIRAVRHDAWTLHPNRIIGRVWLIRQADDEVIALTTICPHLGCAINHEQTTGHFICPCHNSVFDRTGQRSLDADHPSNPSPRDLDRLETKLTPIPGREGDFHVAVRHESFIQGREDRVAEG